MKDPRRGALGVLAQVEARDDLNKQLPAARQVRAGQRSGLPGWLNRAGKLRTVRSHGGEQAPDDAASRFDQRYRFAGGWVDPSRNLLAIGDRREVLEPRRIEVLVYLISQAGRVVSKEELRREVWEGRTVSVEALVGTIYELRKTLGDNPRQPTYIETVRKRGYRWIPAPEPERAQAERVPVVDNAPRPSARRLWFVAALGVTLLLPGLASLRGALSRTVADPAEAVGQEASQELLKGQHFLRRARPKDLKRAEASFQRAIDLEPDNAEAFAGYAQAFVQMAEFSLGDRFELYRNARAHAEQALKLQPELAVSHAALGHVHMALDWDFSAAESSFRQAIALNPESSKAHEWRSKLLAVRGHLSEAERAARMAIASDPVAVSPYACLSFALVLQGRYDEAAYEARRGLELNDQDYFALWGLWYALRLSGDHSAAVVANHRMLASYGLAEDQLAGLRATFDQRGFDAFLQAYDELLTAEWTLVEKATVSMQLGRYDEALQRLRQATRQKVPAVLWLSQYPEFAPLHDRPAFRDLLETVGALEAQSEKSKMHSSVISETAREMPMRVQWASLRPH